MKNLVQRLRQPSDFYFTDKMTAKKANALYTSLLQDGAAAIEALETKCAMQKGLIDGFVTVNNRLESEVAQLKAELGDLPEAQADMLHTIKQLKAELAIRIGWKLVPLEPTDAMLQADVETDAFIGIDDARKLYNAMIAAAPGAKP